MRKVLGVEQRPADEDALAEQSGAHRVAELGRHELEADEQAEAADVDEMVGIPRAHLLEALLEPGALGRGLARDVLLERRVQGADHGRGSQRVAAEGRRVDVRVVEKRLEDLGCGHEVRNPLHAIQPISEAMAMDLDENPIIKII